MIHVIAMITTQPGMRDTVLQEFRANVPNVLAEAGCIEYGPAIDTPLPAAEGAAMQAKLGPDTFAVIEKWADLPALQAHAASPHMLAYGAKVRPMLASRAVHILSPA